MHVPDNIRLGLRAIMDDPDHVGKEVAQRICRSRSTLYRVLAGDAGIKTLRKLAREFPNLIEPNSDTLGQRRF